VILVILVNLLLVEFCERLNVRNEHHLPLKLEDGLRELTGPLHFEVDILGANVEFKVIKEVVVVDRTGWLGSGIIIW
jgi:hypothetical protein